MNLPNTIAALIKAQDNFDSHAYANCFSETAHVIDEGITYHGRAEIQRWIQKANDEFKTVIKPLQYVEAEEILKAEISGNFEGSPAVLTYHFELIDGVIQSLKITG
ncbi:nuclear transport factor 2 family protein [Sphingobacterium olei]|uniref:Nuclear transport factor 2 family protein n=1 Tax=Sphingobacterium olei TaxID=2571155 RepID=A0A4U0P7C8_9SPHI|nr:nuclear transport factor 2 family protein [Sphingobacterium olei]TJZ63269.1 nuclear transport factor 2 family protein [Sphingobacterium olei]